MLCYHTICMLVIYYCAISLSQQFGDNTHKWCLLMSCHHFDCTCDLLKLWLIRDSSVTYSMLLLALVVVISGILTSFGQQKHGLKSVESYSMSEKVFTP